MRYQQLCAIRWLGWWLWTRRAGDERCPMCDVGGAPCLGAVPRARCWWCGEFGVYVAVACVVGLWAVMRGRFWSSCADACLHWARRYHPTCLGLLPFQTRVQKQYICPYCSALSSGVSSLHGDAYSEVPGCVVIWWEVLMCGWGMLWGGGKLC